LIKAVIFDFDGLILDTEYALYDAFCQLLQVGTDQLPIQEYATYIGSDGKELYNYILSKSNGELSLEEVIEKSDILHRENLKKPVAREGVEDYLVAAKQKGLKIALATSSNREWASHFLTKLGFINYFDILSTKDDVENVKPDPAVYQNAIKQLGVLPEEVIAFEDSGNGTKAAVAAGANCVIVPNAITENLPFTGHKLRLSSMTEMSFADVLAKIEETL